MVSESAAAVGSKSGCVISVETDSAGEVSYDAVVVGGANADILATRDPLHLHLGTYQGRIPNSTNGCTVIAPLLVIRHLNGKGNQLAVTSEEADDADADRGISAASNSDNIAMEMTTMEEMDGVNSDAVVGSRPGGSPTNRCQNPASLTGKK